MILIEWHYRDANEWKLAAQELEDKANDCSRTNQPGEDQFREMAKRVRQQMLWCRFDDKVLAFKHIEEHFPHVHAVPFPTKGMVQIWSNEDDFEDGKPCLATITGNGINSIPRPDESLYQ